MTLTDFTSYADIRAALGVGEAEIEDTVISLPIYVNNLGMEMDSISLSLVADFTTATAAVTPTAAQSRFLRAMQLFASYAVARQLTTSLPLFSPKEIHDGKASMVRYAQNPYDATIKAVKQAYETYKIAVIDSFGELHSAGAAVAVTRTYFARVASSYDPVTGV